jgi:predicted TIM-barrel fold metal-dependent hydrolase
MIIDAHIHIPVISETRNYQQSKRQTLRDMKKDGISYAILIPDNIPNSVIGDVPTCLGLVADTPEIFLMGTFNLESQGQAWLQRLADLIDAKQIVGMKIFPGHDPIYPTDPRLDPLYELCQESGVPMVIHTGWNPGHPEVGKYNDPRHIVQIAGRYPDMKIVIAHYFWPEVDYCYQLTHDIPNIYYDTSGLADEEVVDAAGPERIREVLLKSLSDKPGSVLFGTDYAMCSFQEHIRLVKDLPVSNPIREGIFWRNAVQVFNLPIPVDVA